MKTPISILIVALIAAGAAQAEKFYKWQDENGTWHYSTTEPKDQPAEAVKVNARPATPSEEELAMKAAEEKAAVARADSGVDSANCKRARDNLQILLNNGTVQKDIDGDGKEEVLSAAEHQAEVSATRKQVKTFCGE